MTIVRFIFGVGSLCLTLILLAGRAAADQAPLAAVDAFYHAESLESIEAVFEADCDFPDLERLEQARLAELAALAERDRGFRLTASYRLREGGLVGNRHRADLGLAWDVLDDGWLEQRWEARRLRQEHRLAAQQAFLHRARRLLACREDRLRLLFVDLDRRLLAWELPWLARFVATLRERYYQGRLLYDDVLRWEALEHRLQQRWLDYQAFPAARAALPPLYSLDWKAVAGDDPPVPPLAAEEELLRYRHPWFDDIRLTVFAGGGLRGSDEIRPTLTTGMRFSLPLRLPLTRPVPESERRRVYALWEESRRRRRLRLRELFEQYQRKLEDAIDRAARREILRERLRRDRLLMSDGNFDDRIWLQHVVEYLDVTRAAVEIRRSLYHQLLKLASLQGVAGFPRHWLRPVTLARFQRRPGERALYVWRAGLERVSPDRLLDFLAAKGIDRLLVSGSARIDPAVKRRLQRLTRQRGVALEWVLGEPGWLDPDAGSRIEDRIRRLPQAEPLRVQLDIEPHLLPDFEVRRAHYQQRWLERLAWLRSRFPQVRWSVALPLRYEPDFFQRMAQVVERIYLMAYGFDPDYLIRRLAPLRPLLASGSLVVAVRLDDFTDEAGLERYLGRLYREAGCRRFALHDFRRALTVMGR